MGQSNSIANIVTDKQILTKDNKHVQLLTDKRQEIFYPKLTFMVDQTIGLSLGGGQIVQMLAVQPGKLEYKFFDNWTVVLNWDQLTGVYTVNHARHDKKKKTLTA